LLGLGQLEVKGSLEVVDIEQAFVKFLVFGRLVVNFRAGGSNSWHDVGVLTNSVIKWVARNYLVALLSIDEVHVVEALPCAGESLEDALR